MSSGYEARRLALKAVKLAVAAQDAAGEELSVLRQNLSVPLQALDSPFTPAPTVILAAAALRPKGSGLYLCTFTYTTTVAAADSLIMTAATDAGITSVTGGTLINGWNVPSGGAVAVTGAAGLNPVGQTTQSVAAGDLTATVTVAFPAQLAPGALGAIVVEIAEGGGGHALTNSFISLICQEQP